MTTEDEGMENKIRDWLDSHQDFAIDYYSRKSLQIVCEEVDRKDDKTYLSTSAPSSPMRRKISPNIRPPLIMHRSKSVQRPISRDLSGFEGANLGPIINNDQGTPTFVRSCSYIPRSNAPRRQKSIDLLKQMKNVSESALFIELVEDIASDLDITSLSHKILQNVCILTNADRCSLFLVQKDGNNIPTLTSKIFNCNAESTLDDMKKNTEMVVPWGKGIVGYVAETGEKVNIPDAYDDSRFSCNVDMISHYKTKSLLCLPIKHHNHDGGVDVVGVAQALNKIDDQGQATSFSEDDVKIFEKYLAFCAIRISNAQLFERLDMEMKRNEVLLDVAQIIFEKQLNLKDIVYKIMNNTHTLIECQRLSLLLLELNLEESKGKGSSNFSHVFDFESSDFAQHHPADVIDDVQLVRNVSRDNPKFPVNVGIIEHVARTGETLNLSNPYEDYRFDPSVEGGSTFVTKTVLCMPVRNSNRKIIGVVQLVNKANDKPFSANDENLFEALAIYCGMAINNTSLYEECRKSCMRQKIAIDMLSYHATASNTDVLKLSTKLVPTTPALGLCDFSFDDSRLSEEETLVGTIGMFCDLGLVEKFRLDYEVLCSWVLTVKKNYRQVVYHNWRHAFNVTQNMFVTLSNVTQLKEQFTDEEKLALMIACLCHDIDHRGLTNNFQVQTSSPLAQLYGTSVMERHHLDHCIRILNSTGNDLLSSLSPVDYDKVIKVIEECILATDLAVHFQQHKQYLNILKQKSFEWSNNKHRSHLRSSLMTASDLAATAKPWPVHKRVSHMLAEEYYREGDLEHKDLNLKPIVLRDRAKFYKFPKEQVSFVDNIILPLYQNLAEQYPVLHVQVNYIIDNRKHWLEQAECAEEFLERFP